MAGRPDILQQRQDRLIILRAGSGRDIDRLAAVVVDLGKDRLVAAAVIAHRRHSGIGHGKVDVISDRAGRFLQLLTRLGKKIRVGVGHLQQHDRVAELVAGRQREGIRLRHDRLLPLVLIVDDGHAVVTVTAGIVRLLVFDKAVTAVKVEHKILKAAPRQGKPRQDGEGGCDTFFHKVHSFYNSMML